MRMRAPAVALSMLVLAVAAAAQPLPQLQAWALEAAPSLRLAELEAQAQQQRLEAAQAGGSTSFIAGASVADAREAVTDTAVRDYRRAGVQAGLRWSLLAANRAREQATGEARAGLDSARLRAAQARTELLERLRTAYVDAHFAAERAAYGAAFLQGEPRTRRWMQRRRGEHLLLEADRLAFASMFGVAARERSRALAARDEALRWLRRLTGRPLDGFASTLPVADDACPSLDAALAGAAQRPAVALAAAQVQAQRERLQRAGALDMELGLSLTQSLTRDLGGPGGRASVVALDLSIPLGADRARQAQRAAATTELARAQLLLDERTADDRMAVVQAHDALRLRRDDASSGEQQFAAAREAWRVARLRAHGPDGDGLARELQARYALYQAAVAFSQARQRRLQTQLAWQALADGRRCEGAAPTAPQAGAAASAAPAALAAPDDAAWTPQALRAALGGAAVAAAARSSDGRWLGWYVWQADAWLTRAPWDALPGETGTLALSFSPAQLEHLGTEAQAQRLRDLLDEAHRRGFAVHWLLGEPTWVLPDARSRLLALLRRLSGFAFDALHLDLERSQLPPAQQADWSGQLLETIAAVHRSAPWPLVLTTHHREFADRGFVGQLAQAGLAEGVAMVYASAPGRALQLARTLAGAELPLSLAQSIEPELPAQESSARLGRRGSLALWRQLEPQLRSEAGVDGIFVQSWETFEQASP